jgi:HNH endonuclease
MRSCSIEGCSRKHLARGLCAAHYLRRWRSGELRPEYPIGGKRIGSRNSRWKGGEFASEGRIFIYAPDHPFPSRNDKYVLRYRLRMEKHLGRYLTPDEFVHHINGNMMDDRIENLQIMSNSEHIALHNKTRKR